MDKQEFKGLIDHMEAAQNEVLDSITARKGKEYTALVARHGSAIAVFQAAGSAFVDHPQIQIIENAVNFGIQCVVQVGTAQALRLEGCSLNPSAEKLTAVADEFQGDLEAFVQQTVQRVKVSEQKSK